LKSRHKLNEFVIDEIQLILSEKRTALSIMRTGIAVFALPLSVLSVLIATSKLYAFEHVMTLLIPLLMICLGLIVLGVALIFRAIVKIRHYDRIINKLTKDNGSLSTLIE
jgi:hypothetical protein